MAGIVTAVGDGVSTVRVGDRVLANTTYGAFAEEVRTAANRVVPIPDSMDFMTAAAFILTYGTADHALSDRGRLQLGETLLVLGAAGGVGLAAVEIGRALGARVIACASTDAKLAVCREHGADEVINYETEDLRERIRSLTGGRGADVVCDAVGGTFTEPALRSLAWRGRLLIVGFASGEIPRVPMNLPLLKGCEIVGVFYGEFGRREPERLAARIRQLGAWYAEGKLRPHVSTVLPLSRTADAINLLASRQATGKVVVVP